MSENRTNISNLKAGDRLSRTSYYQVVGQQRNGDFVIENQDGLRINITPNIIEQEMYSATQVTETKKVSRTQMVEQLENAGDTIFTVVFNKQPTAKDVSTQLGQAVTAARADSGFWNTARERTKAAKELLLGEERTLTGYLLATEPKMGRSTVYDLEVSSGHPLRLVDHRSIKELTLRNVRYVLK